MHVSAAVMRTDKQVTVQVSVYSPAKDETGSSLNQNVEGPVLVHSVISTDESSGRRCADVDAVLTSNTDTTLQFISCTTWHYFFMRLCLWVHEPQTQTHMFVRLRLVAVLPPCSQ